jgi:hypothetical protein
MKFTAPLRRTAVFALLSTLLLSGCGGMDWFGGRQQFPQLEIESTLAAAPEPLTPHDPLLCRIGRGTAHFRAGWEGFGTADFRLAPGGRANVPLARKKGSDYVTIQGIFDADGQKLIFCPVIDGPPDKRIACSSLYALDEDLKLGIKRTFDVPGAIRGSEISCAYNAGLLKPL